VEANRAVGSAEDGIGTKVTVFQKYDHDWRSVGVSGDRASLVYLAASFCRSVECCRGEQPGSLLKKPMKEEQIEVEGRVQSVLPGTMFRVELDNKHLVLATICGKMRKRWVRLTVGDRVKMEMSPYDLSKARIVWRLGERQPSQLGP